MGQVNSKHVLNDGRGDQTGASGVGVDVLAYTRAELAPMQGEGHPFRSRRIR
jgi:hypothetical protein